MGVLFSDASNWIWMEEASEVNCYLTFREEFTLQERGEVRLLISAEGQYAVFLDGRYVPSTQYPDFPSYKSVQAVPLEMPDRQKEHVLEVQVLYPGRDSAVARKEPPGLRFELLQGEKLLKASGKGTKVRLTRGYQSGEVPILTPQLGYGFLYEDPGQSDGEASWKNGVITEKSCVFAARPVRELEVGPRKKARLLSQGIFTEHESGLSQYAGFHFRELSRLVKTAPKAAPGERSPENPEGTDAWPQEGAGAEGFALADLESLPDRWFPSEKGVCVSSEEGDGIYLIFDLGEETVGYLDLDLVCPRACPVDVSYGEHLEDLRVRSDVGGRHFTFRWEAPSERHPFVHRFHRLGGRYLQLLLYGHEAMVYYAGLLPVSYPLGEGGDFQCGDHLHSRIYQVAKHTLRCCLHEHYEDCPWREQALYAFDSRNQMLFGYYAFGEFEQPRANLRLLALSQREDGLLELCAPARVNVNIPAFSLMFLVELEEYCRYSGDLPFGEEMLPVAGRILRTVHGHVRDGLVWNFREPQYWNFYEWRPLLEGTPIERTRELPPSAEAPLQLFYLLALQRMERLCGWLNKEAPGLKEEIRIVTEGLEGFWDPRQQAYASFLRGEARIQYAELVQALALCTGAVPKERQAALREGLSAGKFVPISMSASVFRYDALLQDPEKYGSFVFEEVARRWGGMLYQGATAFWETDLGAEDFERAGSLCHGWSSVPVYLYGAYALGVRPEEPGKWRASEEIPDAVCGAWGRFLTPEGEFYLPKRR